ncbi:MAG: VOC family protein [Zavarzinia sp.]|nr:VOC family protein [Zavarzinia sp.]
MPDRQALFRPDRFAHANLYVGDVERSVAFYRDVCGVKEVFREPAIKAGFLGNGATHHDIALMQCADGPLIGRDGTVQNTMARGRSPGLNHIAFHVATEESLIDAFGRAEKLGIKVEKALDHGMSRSLYLFDPDGNAVEFYVDIVADWRRFYDENRDSLITSRWDPSHEPPVAAHEPLPRRDDRVPGASLQPREICGATLIVADPQASLRFYRDVAGLELRQATSDVNLLALPGMAEPCLALVSAMPGERIGLHSLWFLADPDSPALAGTAGGRTHLRDPDGLALTFHAGTAALPRHADRRDALAA